MDRIDTILETYERDLQRAREGECKKISRCTEFRDSFKKQYREKYALRLEEWTGKLLAKGHEAKLEERSSDEMHYGFSLSVVPRHLLTTPVDRFHPLHLRSSIFFIANEHTLSIDVETVINPKVKEVQGALIEKVPTQQFTEDVMESKIAEFLEKVFYKTIVLDFRRP